MWKPRRVNFLFLAVGAVNAICAGVEIVFAKASPALAAEAPHDAVDALFYFAMAFIVGQLKISILSAQRFTKVIIALGYLLGIGMAFLAILGFTTIAEHAWLGAAGTTGFVVNAAMAGLLLRAHERVLGEHFIADAGAWGIAALTALLKSFVGLSAAGLISLIITIGWCGWRLKLMYYR